MKRQSSETQRIIGERKILNKKRTPRKHKMRMCVLSKWYGQTSTVIKYLPHLIFPSPLLRKEQNTHTHSHTIVSSQHLRMYGVHCSIKNIPWLGMKYKIINERKPNASIREGTHCFWCHVTSLVGLIFIVFFFLHFMIFCLSHVSVVRLRIRRAAPERNPEQQHNRSEWIVFKRISFVCLNGGRRTNTSQYCGILCYVHCTFIYRRAGWTAHAAHIHNSMSSDEHHVPHAFFPHRTICFFFLSRIQWHQRV